MSDDGGEGDDEAAPLTAAAPRSQQASDASPPLSSSDASPGSVALASTPRSACFSSLSRRVSAFLSLLNPPTDLNSTPASSVRAFASSLHALALSRAARPSWENLNPPPLHAASLLEVLALSATQLEPLFIYLHSELHPCSATVAATLCDVRVHATLTDLNCIAWGASVHSQVGYRAAADLDAAAFPFLALYIAGSSPRSFHRVAALEGVHVSVDDCIAFLTTSTALAGVNLNPARASRTAVQVERALAAEQEAAYAEAEAADRSAAAARELEAAREAEAAEAAELEAALALSVTLGREADLNAAAARVALHPEPERGPDTSSLRIQLPSGHRVERRFKSSDSVSLVRDYVRVVSRECGHPLTSFDLCTTFPRRVWREGEDTEAHDLKTVGLFPQAMLLVTQTPEQAAVGAAE